MCYIELEPCEVWSETRRRACKEHQCSCCRRTIRVGEEYLAHFSVYEGDCCRDKCCGECARDREEFAAAHGGQWCQPGCFPDVLGSCIGDGDPDDDRWRPMMERIDRLRSEAAADRIPA